MLKIAFFVRGRQSRESIRLVNIFKQINIKEIEYGSKSPFQNKYFTEEHHR